MDDNSTAHLTNLSSQVVCRFLEPSTVNTASKILSYTLIMVVGLVGNVVLCLVVYKNKNLRKPIDYLIVNIAVSDLAIPILAIPRNISALMTGSDVWGVSGAFGDFLCKFVFFLCDICPVVSIISLVFLTASRFVAVVFPFQASTASGKLKPRYFIASTWIIAVLFFSPYFYILHLNQDHRCTFKWGPYLDDDAASKVFNTIIITIFLLVPFVLTAIMYAVILRKLKKRSKRIPNQNENARKKREKSTRNITMLSFFIVLAFGLCWGPFFSLLILEDFFPYLKESLTQCQWITFLFVAQYLAYSNTAVNPLLCLVFIKNFRQGLRKLTFYSYRNLEERYLNPTKASHCTREKLMAQPTMYCTSV